MVAPSFEVKQKVLQLVVQRIVVEDHHITIEHVVPRGPIRLQPEHHLNRYVLHRIYGQMRPLVHHAFLYIHAERSQPCL